METLYKWAVTMLAAGGFLVTLAVCLLDGQDLLACALKSIAAFFIIRLTGNVLINILTALEQAVPDSDSAAQGAGTKAKGN